IVQLVMTMLGPYFPALEQERQVIEVNVGLLTGVSPRVGLLSAITLTWSATGAFIALQQALDTIWESPQRSLVARRLVAFFMLCALVVVSTGAALVLTLAPHLRQHPAVAAWDPVLNWLSSLSRTLFPLSLGLGFTVTYRFLPARKPDWGPVWLGALVAALLLDVGRHVFVWYAGLLFDRYQFIYGTLSAVMLLVLWMYTGCMVLLFGAEVAAAVQRWQSQP
ncbi:MAG: YihY/virulence factor BrkB family protein, partial [Alicyclobacillus sp.]|nr:YihY/virulence factor BrkB family protein [Alicyclobacillus sp.]